MRSDLSDVKRSKSAQPGEGGGVISKTQLVVNDDFLRDNLFKSVDADSV